MKATEKDLKKLSQGALDEIVHDCFSIVAMTLNNKGKEAQIKYLLEWGITKEEIV